MHLVHRAFAPLVLAALAASGCRSAVPVAPGESPGDMEVPLERLGLPISWDPVTEKARLSGGSDVVVGLGSKTALVDGSPVDLDAPVRVSGGRLQAGGDLKERLAARARGRPAAPPPARSEIPVAPSPSPRTEAAIRPTGSPAAIRMGVLVLDAGHGGKDPGTVHGQTYEKDLVLDICRRALPHLERAGFDVRVTRADDRFVELDDRVGAVSRNSADLFVSVHVNANDRSDLSGFEIYHKSNPEIGGGLVVERSRDLAQAIQSAFQESLPVPDRGIRTDVRGLRVLKKNTVPAVLVEVAYISNSQDRALVVDPAFRESVARALATGIERFRRR